MAGRRSITLALLFASVAIAANVASAADAPAPAPACTSAVSGDLRLHTLRSVIFGNERTIRVLLPHGYDDAANAQRRYPVLYLLDGQNVFDACRNEVSHDEWRADETSLQLTTAGHLPPMILVGVDHAGTMRAHEYLPYKDFVGAPDMNEPAGKRLPDFLAREVMPLVNGTYRTLTGAPNTGIGGSSYAGAATLYALLARPNDFGFGLIESPTLWVGMGQLVRDTQPLAALPYKVFVGFGGKETEDADVSAKLVSFVRALEANLRAAGYDDSNLRVVIDPEARHTEAAWAKRLPEALTFLFGDWTPPGPAQP